MTLPFLIVAIAIVILWGFPKSMKQHVYKKITKALSEKRYEDVQDTIDSFWCTFSYKPYNREFMRLTVYTMQGNQKAINNQLKMMFAKLKMSQKQKIPLAKRAFYFYLETNQFQKAKSMLSICKSDSNSEELHTMIIMYDILAEHKSNHIQEIKDTLDRLKKQENAYTTESNIVRIGIYEYLLGLQFSYLKNEKTSNSYLKEALKHCRNTPYEPLIRNAL